MREKRVVIVDEGRWGMAIKKDYDGVVKAIKWMLERATKKIFGKEGKRAGFVKVVDTTEMVLEMIKSNDVDVLIFNSRSMISEAREIKRKYRHLKVIVLTGLIPDDEIILVDKGWIGSQFLETVVFV